MPVSPTNNAFRNGVPSGRRPSALAQHSTPTTEVLAYDIGGELAVMSLRVTESFRFKQKQRLPHTSHECIVGTTRRDDWLDLHQPRIADIPLQRSEERVDQRHPRPRLGPTRVEVGPVVPYPPPQGFDRRDQVPQHPKSPAPPGWIVAHAEIGLRFCADAHVGTRLAFEFLVLTAARSGEVCGAL